MMNMQQNIHGVVKIRATNLHRTNSNAVTVDIETEGGTLSQTVYFGNGVKEASDASAYFYALGGEICEVVGSPEYQEKYPY